MKTLTEIRDCTACWIDEQAIADLRKAWRFANLADQARIDGCTVRAFLYCLLHGYYLSRGDQRHDAATLIRPNH